ncbi:MAG: hypothetical protein WAN30_01785 [Acidimicrobiales bacterium]
MRTRPLVLATLEGYSVEGGFDRPREPATCFSPTISLGRHPGPGQADGLWLDYERVLDLAATLGLDGVRLSVEWARVEAHRDVFDESSLARYLEVIRYARSLGLRVTLATVGDAWPAWLGLEAWLLPWVAPRVTRYVRRVVSALGSDIDGLVIFADPEGIVRRGFLDGTAPPWRRGARLDYESAMAQLTSVIDELSRDPALAPHVVERWCTTTLDESALERALASDVSEVYLRALVKGKGPTAATGGLLVKHGGDWRVSPERGVLDLLT